ADLIKLEPYDVFARQAQAQAQLTSAEALLQLAQITSDRVKNSFQVNASSASEVDKANADLKNAEAQQKLRKAELDQIAEEIKELKILSPCDGIVQAVDLQPGDLVAPNAPVLSVLDTSHLWVRAYVPENRLDLQINQKLQITVDSFPNRKFTGHLTFVSRQ